MGEYDLGSDRQEPPAGEAADAAPQHTDPRVRAAMHRRRLQRKATHERHKAAADDDWQVEPSEEPPAREAVHDEDLNPSIVMTPDTDFDIAPIGGEIDRTFTIDHAGKNKHNKLEWKHELDGAQAADAPELLSPEVSNGRSSKVRVRPRVVGQKTVKTSLTETKANGERVEETGPEVELITPPPKVNIVKLDSESDRGANQHVLPVTDTFQLGEELIVTARLDEVQGSPDVKTQFAGNLDVTSTKPLGDGMFEVRMTPRELGEAGGILWVLPAETSPGDVTPAPIDLKVEPMADSHDYGGSGSKDDPGRPKDLDDALTRIPTKVAAIYDKRSRGVDNLIAQIGEQDPKLDPDLGEEIAVGLVKAALGAATAGVGVAIGDMIAGADNAVAHEVVKVFAEKNVNTTVDSVRVPARADAQKEEQQEYGGVKRGAKAYFHALHQDALASEGEAVSEKAHTRASAIAADLTKSDSDNAAFHGVVDTLAKLDAEAEPALDEQYIESFQAWSSLIAQNQLGASDQDGNDATQQQRESGQAGTKLDDVMHDWPTETYYPVECGMGVCETSPLPVTQVNPGAAGVLRLELARQDGGKLTIVSAHLSGFDNQDIRETVNQVPLRDLKIPIVASLETSQGEGFHVGRNEAGVYYADPPDSPALLDLVYSRSSPGTAKDAARKILDEELGDERVTPEDDSQGGQFDIPS